MDWLLLKDTAIHMTPGLIVWLVLIVAWGVEG